MQLAGLQTQADTPGFDAKALQAAVKASGLFSEARTTHVPAGGQAPAAPAADLKQALIQLRAALQDALPKAEKPAGPDAPRPEAQTAAALRPPAPQRGALPMPQMAEAGVDMASDKPLAILTQLSRQTEAAIDRITLAQFASLPSQADLSTSAPLNRWAVELPIQIDSRAAVLPLEIEEDRSNGHGGGAAAKPWRVRFALDIEPLGLINALITMQARTIAVAVWAERESTSRLVRDFAPSLQAALEDERFDKAEIDVLLGRPAARPAPAGQFLDRAS
jgi:hypothetical protein